MSRPAIPATPPDARWRPFGLLDPLPSGRLAIEASAGTGKTFTLTALATRFIAERGVDPSELLVVTYTRAATAELRVRLRERLIEATGALRASLDGGVVLADPLVAHLTASDRSLSERGLWLARLERAVTEFDAATITTIHGFAAAVLGLLGSAAGIDPEAVLVDDTTDLLNEVSADVLAAAATEGHPVDFLPDFDELRRAVDVATRSPDVLVVPRPDDEGTSAADRLRAELVRRVVARVAERRRRSGTLGFDDLLGELRRALRGDGGEAAIEAVRARYRVALIDEFQDTDPAQWDILSALFTGAGVRKQTLVLVGDPKQAIYGFRGADIHTYLRALESVDQRRSLLTNWRSDGAALRALDLLLEGISFGDERIAFASVQAAEAHRERRLTGGDGRPLPALHLRLAVGEDLPRAKKSHHDIPIAEAERAVTSDLVAQVRGLLEDARIPDVDPQAAPAESAPVRGPGPGGTPMRRVRPSDLAVLVRSSKEAALVQSALLEEGIPAVQARGGSVMASPAVEQWRWLLEALRRPADPARARLFALSWFAGRSPDWVAAASEAEMAGIHDLLHSWNETLTAGGVGDLIRRIWSDSGVMARVLARADGDRDLTDLGHIAEILQAVPGRRVSVDGLMARLEREMPANADAEVEADVAARRIESDADAVRIMTVWVAKGLEFPIALCPTLWRLPAEAPMIYHDPDEDRRIFDVSARRGGVAVSGAPGSGAPDSGAPDAGVSERAERAAGEAHGENLRLLYVALTRARHQTVLWWAPTRGSHTTALARVLFSRSVDARGVKPGGAGARGNADGGRARARGNADGGGAESGGAESRRAESRRAESERAGVRGNVEVSRQVCAPSDSESTLEALAPLLERAAGDIVATVVGRPTRSLTPWTDPQATPPAPELSLARLERVPDRSSHRWSFTAIASRADLDHRDPHGPDTYDAPHVPEGTFAYDGAHSCAFEKGDEPASDDAPVPLPAPETLTGTGLALLPSGTGFGSLVHAVLEATDFASENLTGVLGSSIDRVLPWLRMDLTPIGVPGATTEDGRRLLAEGLLAALDTPLGPLMGGRRLRDFPKADRIDEMSFELRLGERGTAPTDADVGRVILRHLPPGDPFRSWAESLAGGLFDALLAGHLTGSIDSVIRIRGRSDRFVVVDYKTNRLHPPGCVPTVADYDPERMTDAMVQHSYPLQALLYLVALHRYLRWRLRGYDPATHLAGAAYLFVRGMTGEATPTTGDTPHGMCFWRVPPEMVVELSDLLAGCPDAAVPAPTGGAGGSSGVAGRGSRRERARRSARTAGPTPSQLSLLHDGAPTSDAVAGEPDSPIPPVVAAGARR